MEKSQPPRADCGKIPATSFQLPRPPNIKLYPSIRKSRAGEYQPEA